MPNTKEKGKLIEVLSKHIPYGYAELCLIADELMAEGVTVQEWISVNDRLPKNGQSVLTYKNGTCDIMTYEAQRNGWISGSWFWSMAVATHWMPLPQPPKGE